MRIFKTKWVARFAKRERISDSSLREAIERAERGIIDADLGGGLIKQRVARSGQGRSGGYRMLVGYRLRDRALFLFGYAKSQQENIGADELATARELAAEWLTADTARIAQAIDENEMQEVFNDEENT